MIAKWSGYYDTPEGDRSFDAGEEIATVSSLEETEAITYLGDNW